MYTAHEYLSAVNSLEQLFVFFMLILFNPRQLC